MWKALHLPSTQKTDLYGLHKTIGWICWLSMGTDQALPHRLLNPYEGGLYVRSTTASTISSTAHLSFWALPSPYHCYLSPRDSTNYQCTIPGLINITTVSIFRDWALIVRLQPCSGSLGRLFPLLCYKYMTNAAFSILSQLIVEDQYKQRLCSGLWIESRAWIWCFVASPPKRPQCGSWPNLMAMLYQNKKYSHMIACWAMLHKL